LKTVNFQYQTKLTFSSPVTEHRFSLKILPQSDDRQRIEELVVNIEPEGVTWNSTDGFGNRLLNGHIEFPHEHFCFGIKGTANMADVPYTMCSEPERVLFYPTELTRPDKKLVDLYKEIELSAPENFLERLKFYSQEVHARMRYERGVTSASTTAEEALAAGAGVCQDYTHILLSLLRQDGICCRYTAGFASDSGETHAWAEAWIKDRYYGIDPTRNKLIDESYIAISRGRDFEDASIERGIFKGMCNEIVNVQLSMEILQ